MTRQLIAGLDAMATLRHEMLHRGGSLVAAASLAELAGADALRVGLCEDLVPVTEADVRDLRRSVRTLEMRIAPLPSLIKYALEARPDRVLLAAESRSGGHRTGPLDFSAWGSALPPVVRTLEEAGIVVAARVAPHPEAVKAARGLELKEVELETGQLVDLPPAELATALETLSDATRLAAKLKLRVGIGGRLDERTLASILEAATTCEWVSMGREWVARCLLVGVDRATRDLRARL